MKLKIAILFLIPLLSFSQLSTKVDSLYNALNSRDQIESQNIGYGGEESNSFQIYTELDSIATDDEILYMTKNGNNTVKGYMSEVLVSRKSKHIADLFSDYIKNDFEVNIQTGCTGYTSSIASELYSYVFYQNNKIESIKYNIEHYTPQELKESNYLETETNWTKHEVDSLLTILNKTALSNDNVLPVTLRKIFAINKFKFENYERIRYFANKYPEMEILATLASFQNKKDLPLLHQNIDNAFIAISKFPDKSFIKDLQDKFEKNVENVDYYEALSVMCFDETNTLKKAVFEKISNSDNIFTQEYIQYLEASLKRSDCEFNQELVIRIEEFYNR